MSIDARDVHEGTSKSGLLLNVTILYLARTRKDTGHGRHQRANRRSP